MHVSAKILRANLGYYLDCTARGEEVFIIRNSMVVAQLIPVNNQIYSRQIGAAHQEQALQPNIADNQLVVGVDGEERQVIEFREMGPYENPDILRTLYIMEPAAPDHGHPASYCQAFGGEFWLAVAAGEVIGCGGFYIDLTAVGGADTATTHRLHQAPKPHSKAIMERLLAILFERAAARGLQLSK
jgi:antitoxin (DNA-binding transcriptional repressor) of toxin-antitoxin stability system